MLNLRKEEKGKVIIVYLEGRLDSNNVKELEKLIDELYEAEKFNIVFDFKQLEYISSAGLRVFLMTFKKAQEKKSIYALCSLQGLVNEVFDLAGFSKVLPIYPELTAVPELK